ncbi:transcription factor IIIC subunit delta N-term-domain-containing protein [Hysterangium stoloniferum]|nr:transcription factor IIIC subunit delta N-term-domain-containing protein [Hysterangium stoloniferum]
MADVEALTCLTFPVTAHGPSLTTLQWSEDGQVFLLTRGTIYILTPNTGISFDPSVLLTASTKTIGKDEDLKWYRTLIELDKTPVHHWPLESDNWGTVALGSLDMSWASIAVSPTNLSNGSCCLLATLTTNLEVVLWAPLKNFLTGEWRRVQDVTLTIKESASEINDSPHKTLDSQVHCINWSTQIPVPEQMRFVDGSLLALGTRSGRVHLMQLSNSIGSGYNGELRLINSVKLTENWITHLAWSSWEVIKPRCFRALLACGIPDGSIFIILVSLALDNDLQPHWEFTHLNNGEPSCEPGYSALTAIKWIETEERVPILTYAKPGIIHIRRMSNKTQYEWAEIWQVALESQPISTSTSPLAPVSGLLYYKQHDALLVSLFEGTFCMIKNISTLPTLHASSDLTSEDLTNRIRAVFALAEEHISFEDVNRTMGLFDYDSAGAIGWFHETGRPHDFSYKHESQHTSMFVVAQIWKDEETILDRLIIPSVDSTNLNAAPTHVLRGIFLHLRNETFIEAHQNLILGRLAVADTLKDDNPTQSTATDLALSIDNLSYLLSVSLFRRKDVRSVRLKLGVSMFCSTISGIDTVSFKTLTADLSNTLLHFQLHIVLRALGQFVTLVEGADRDFIRRWIVLCRTHGPPSLQQEALALSSKVHLPENIIADSPDEQEKCPACHAIVPLGIGKDAVCLNGHHDALSHPSSLQLLSTPSELRKLAWQPSAADSSITHALVAAARWCIFCGNRFVRVL